VDTLQREPAAALDFYGPLLGWEFSEPGPGGYVVARLEGKDVAGIGPLPVDGPAIWGHVRARGETQEAAVARRAGRRRDAADWPARRGARR